MEYKKMSNSPVLNAVYADIWESLEELGPDEVKHYMRGFPHEVDYNLVQYGNMRVYYCEIRDMYVDAGAAQYAKVRKRAGKNGMRGDWLISNDELWEHYKRDVGHVAREYVKR